METNINPKLLRWAREESGISIEQIASRLDIDVDRYAQWESQGSDIPFGKLKDIARMCKRQVAVFFLPAVPPRTKKPTDYRNMRANRQEVSSQTLLAMRRSLKYRALALDIRGSQYWKDEYEWLAETRGLPSQLSIEWLRRKLGITVKKQTTFSSTSEAWKTWREAVEIKLGIFVFQFPLPTDEVQGFCYSEAPPYAIVLNSNYAYASRVFTLFHEIAHLLRNQSGLCLPDNLDPEQRLELHCNVFAGKFLVPDEQVSRADTLQALTAGANHFKVSKEVILFRNLERKYLSRTLFFELLAEIQSQPIPEKSTGPILPLVKSHSSRGEAFFNLVLDSAQKNIIDFNTASDALGLKLSHIVNG